MAKKKYHGTQVAKDNLNRKIINADIRDEEQFFLELKNYLNELNAEGEFVTFNNVFKTVLANNPEYQGLKEKELKDKIKEKCDIIENDEERKRIWRGINRFLGNGEGRPHRETVVETAIVLNLGLDELEELLMKGLFQNTICYSNVHELIAVYCIIKEYSYPKYISLIHKYEKQTNYNYTNKKGDASADQEVDSIIFQNEMERMIGDVESIADDDAFLTYLLSFSESLKGYSKRTLDVFYELFEKARKTVDKIAAFEPRLEFWEYLSNNISNGTRKLTDELIKDLREKLKENIKKQKEGMINGSEKIRYGEIKQVIREVYLAYKVETADDEVFNAALNDAFPDLTSDELVIRYIYGGYECQGGLIQDNGRYGIVIKDADLPKQVLNRPLSKDRYHYIRNMVDDYRKYNKLVSEKKKENPDLSNKQILNRYSELQKMENRLRIPQRHEFLMLIYFLYKNAGDEGGEFAREFQDVGSEYLERAGYLPIYEGNLQDILFMALVAKPDFEVTYHEFIRYVLGLEEEL